MGATQKQFQVGDGVRKRMAPLNHSATKLQSKWSKVYQIVAAKGVVATVEHHKTRESLTAQLAGVDFSSPRLRRVSSRNFCSFRISFSFSIEFFPT